MATNTNKYLSLTGLSTFWGKVKAYINNIDVNFTGDVESTDWLAISKATTEPSAEGTKQITFNVNSKVLDTKISALDTKDGELTTAITDEVTRAKAAEKVLTDNLAAEVTNRTNAVADLKTELLGDAAPEYNTLGKLEDKVQALDAKIGTGGNVAEQIKTAIEALDVPDTAVTGSYVSAVSETDGKITVSRTVLPTYNVSATGAFVSVSATTLDDKGKSFEITTSNIASASDLTALTGRVKANEDAITALASATHFRGVADNLDSVANPANGDIVIVGNKEYIYDSVKGWVELGDTTAELQAINNNAAAIKAEEDARKAADEKLDTDLRAAISNAIKGDKISVTDNSTLIDLSVDEAGKVLTIADTTKLTHAVGLAETSVQSVAGTTGNYADIKVVETVNQAAADNTKSYTVAAEFHTADTVATGGDKLTTAEKVKAYVDAKLNGSAHEGSTGDDNISKVVTSVTNREDGTGFDVNFTNFTAITDAEINGLFV